VFAGASWHERETAEMFGIDFAGHPHLVPLLLPDGFEGHPLRKEFVLAAAPPSPGPGAKEPGGVRRRRPCRARPAQDAAARRARRDLGPAPARSRHPGGAVSTAVDVGLRLALVLAAFLTLPLLVGQMEHKAMAHMQSRLGPMYAGGFHGWAQLVADGVKFAQKEAVIPTGADRRVFALAPGVALVPYLVVLIAIPVGPHARRAGTSTPASSSSWP
jgi:NADH-quinone oxidoreductase subunit H